MSYESSTEKRLKRRRRNESAGNPGVTPVPVDTSYYSTPSDSGSSCDTSSSGGGDSGGSCGGGE